MARDPGLDALRAIATLFVIATHAAMAFMVTPIGWAIQDDSHWLGVDLYVWVVRGFIMPVFFWLSGFASRAVYERGGAGGFARHRLGRVALPLALALVPCSLALDALWDWGAAAAHRAAVGTSVPKLQGSGPPLTLGHLWYLYYLLAISAGAIAVVTLARRFRVRALPPATTAALASTIVLVWAGTLALGTPLGFAIDPQIALYEAAFFAWGWMIHARRELLSRYAARAGQAVLASVLLLGAALPALADSRTATGRAPLYAIAASGAFSVATVAAFVGLCVRHARRPSRVLQLISDASYPVYVVHLPVVVALQIALAGVALPWPAKLAIVVAGSLVTCFGGLFVLRGVRRRPDRACAPSSS